MNIPLIVQDTKGEKEEELKDLEHVSLFGVTSFSRVLYATDQHQMAQYPSVPYSQRWV